MSRRRPHRERGFSLIIVFLLMMVMVGLAAGVAMSTQEDLSVSGQDREAMMAFYAAEFAIAQGKDWLSGRPYDSAGGTGWTPILNNTPAAPTDQRCTPVIGANAGKWPGLTANNATNPPQTFYAIGPTGGTMIYWQYCVHNNADDPNYFNGGVPVGDTTDTGDAFHYMVVEGYGYLATTGNPLGPYLAQAHVSATVGTPKFQAGSVVTDYSGEGGLGGAHTGSGGAGEYVSVNTGVTKGL